MASRDELGTSHVSLFPMPPWQLINKYSDTAVKQETAPPPPTPIESSVYRMFGSFCNSDDPILRPLESHGVKRVYPQQYNRKRELRKLNFSLLASYLDLLEVITKDPLSPKRTDKTDHIGILFINMHHLVNEYRPHQVEVSTETTEKAKQYLSKADELLLAASDSLNDASENLLFNDLEPDLRSMLCELKNKNSISSSELCIPKSFCKNLLKEDQEKWDGSNQDECENDQIDDALWKFLYDSSDK